MNTTEAVATAIITLNVLALAGAVVAAMRSGLYGITVTLHLAAPDDGEADEHR